MIKKRRNTTVYLKLQTGTVTLPHGFVTPEFTTQSRDLISYFFFQHKHRQVPLYQCNGSAYFIDSVYYARLKT